MVVRVQLPLGWNTCLFFNSHIVNFVQESNEGEAGKILLIFVLWGCFNCRWVKVEAESLIWGLLKSHLSVPIFFSKIRWAESRSKNEVSRYSAFIGNCLIISHTH